MEGQEFEPSKWLKIDQDTIDSFSDLTIDHNYVHKSTAKENGSPFGDTIAHGLLSLSFVPYLLSQTKSKTKNIANKYILSPVNYGFDKVRFLNPVFVDNRIRGIFKLTHVSKGKKPHSIRQVYTVTLQNENKDSKQINSAVIAQWVAMTIYK